MNKELRIKGIRSFLHYILSLGVLLLAFAVPISAQTTDSITATPEPTQSARQLGITFPIADLGNCASLSECKTYCDDPTHADACIAFAKKKNFYKPPLPDNKKQAILLAAKAQLGCSTQETCATVCQQQENKDKCAAFAKTNNLVSDSNQNKLTSTQLLGAAKTTLGCTSDANCKEFCSKPENQTKCSAFAKQQGLSGGTTQVGPGGCLTRESCLVYCKDSSHADECAKFGYKKYSQTEKGNGQSSPAAGLRPGDQTNGTPFPTRKIMITQIQEKSQKGNISNTTNTGDHDQEQNPPPPPPNVSQTQHQTSGQQQDNPFPTSSVSVKGVSTTRSFWDHLVDILFHK